MNQQQATLGRQWRQRVEEGVLVRLPSGNLARVRGVQPDVVIKSGRLPDSLTPLIADLMDGKAPEEIWKPKTLNDLQDYVEFMNIVCESAMVEPRVVENPQADDEIGIGHLDIEDKEFLVQLVGVSTRALESFRDQQTGDVEPVGTPEGNPSARKRHSKPAAVGAGDDGA